MAQIRSEVWMGLIRGSRGIIYFVHQFKPDFKEAALLSDAETLAGVTAINKQIKELAPVLNSPNIADELGIEPRAPVIAMHKRHGGASYVFAVNLSPLPATVTFTLKGVTTAKAEVLGESREVEVKEGRIAEKFEGYAVHLYQIR